MESYKKEEAEAMIRIMENLDRTKAARTALEGSVKMIQKSTALRIIFLLNLKKSCSCPKRNQNTLNKCLKLKKKH